MAVELALASIPPIDAAPAGASSVGSAVAQASVPQGGLSFAEAVQNAALNAVNDVRGAEKLSMEALSGNADVREVTDAVMSAEQSLQAAIAIRDKIVSAYMEISRMQI